MLQIKILQRLEASCLLKQRACSCEAWSALLPLLLTLASGRPAPLSAAALKVAARSAAIISSRSMQKLSAIETAKTASLKSMTVKPIQSLLSTQSRTKTGASSQSGSSHEFSARFASKSDFSFSAFSISESPQSQKPFRSFSRGCKTSAT